jgi:hypothetical protein
MLIDWRLGEPMVVSYLSRRLDDQTARILGGVASLATIGTCQ